VTFPEPGLPTGVGVITAVAGVVTPAVASWKQNALRSDVADVTSCVRVHSDMTKTDADEIATSKLSHAQFQFWQPIPSSKRLRLSQSNES
jgi:hypothetical protein